MKKTSFWIILIAAIALLAAAAALWLHFRHSDAAVANIYLDGECIRSIDLNAVTEPEIFTVEGPIGTNTIQVEPGRIRVSNAECPDQVCVHMGWLTSEGGMPIVCLPNKLVISLDDVPAKIGDAEIDGVVG